MKSHPETFILCFLIRSCTHLVQKRTEVLCILEVIALPSPIQKLTASGFLSVTKQ